MTSPDPAFQWETEMLRSRSRRTGRGPDGPARVIDDTDDWLTIREASEATGVPPSTIRKWARHGNVPSVLEEASEGYVRVVSMQGIERWASEIGRDIDLEHAGSHTEVDLRPDEDVDESGPEKAPEGSMIVPLDAWNRMLNQLGNLHEAGQQLAEARERAAKAETEARFLKERLADLRDELESARNQSGDDAPGETPRSETGPVSPTSLIKRAYEGWRSLRRQDRDR